MSSRFIGRLTVRSLQRHVSAANKCQRSGGSRSMMHVTPALESYAAAHDFKQAFPESQTPPPTHDWLLYPTDMSLATCEADFCGPSADEVESASGYANVSALLAGSMASPESDFCAPSHQELNAADAYAEQSSFLMSCSFASPESDYCAPLESELSRPALAVGTTLSWASPESDLTAPSHYEVEAASMFAFDSSFLKSVSFASPESDYSAPTVFEQESAESYAKMTSSLSLASAESDFCAAALEAPRLHTEQRQMSLEQALAPSNEARVLTRADEKFEIAHVNEAWTRLCGFTNQESVGKTLGLLQGDATDAAAVQELTATIRQGKSVDAILVNYDAHGRKFRNHLKVTPVVSRETQEITHFLGVLRDIGGVEDQELAQAQSVLAA